MGKVVALATFFEQQSNGQKTPQKRKNQLNPAAVFLNTSLFVEVFLATFASVRWCQPALILDHRGLSYFGQLSAMSHEVTVFSLEPTLGMAHFGEIKLRSSQFDQVKAVLLARGVILNVEVAVGACLTLICGDEKGLPLAEGEEVQIDNLSPTLTALMLAFEAQLIMADGDINVFNEVCDLIDREMNPPVPDADELDEAA